MSATRSKKRLDTLFVIHATTALVSGLVAVLVPHLFEAFMVRFVAFVVRGPPVALQGHPNRSFAHHTLIRDRCLTTTRVVSVLGTKGRSSTSSSASTVRRRRESDSSLAAPSPLSPSLAAPSRAACSYQ